MGQVAYSSNAPFIWDQTHGMRNLAEVLSIEFGLGNELAGWDLDDAIAISDDGTVVIGNGTNPDGYEEGWRAVLVPEPEPEALLINALVLMLLFASRHS